MKTCKRCQQAKPAEAFGPSRNRDGLASWCRQCHRERGSEWAKANRERLTVKAAAWRAANPEKAAEIALRHSRKFAAERLRYSAAWSKANPDKRRAADAKHKAAKRRAVPAWADLQAVAAFYAATPAGHQVDHIVPLVSPHVCGLHCEANLQYLPAAENQSKRNFWWPDMPRIEDAQRQARIFP
jgi:5-methylcytosine-specific restriction endonuclease McrA